MDSTAASSGQLIARQHINGLDNLMGGDALLAALKLPPKLPQGTPEYETGSKVVTLIKGLQYKSGAKIAVFSLTIKYKDPPNTGPVVPSSTDPLYIGHQVDSFPTGCKVDPPINDPQPFSNDFRHYHRYMDGGINYHIVISR